VSAPTPTLRRLADRRFAATALVVAVLGAAGGQVVWSAFVALAQDGGNTVDSGTVTLTDNDSGAMFTLPTLKPNDNAARCIKVSYSGSLTSGVRLYGTTTGTGLDPYLGLVVTRGAYSPSDPGFSSCTNFNADSTTYISGQNAGVVYVGTLEDFPDDYASGIVDPTSGTPEAWTSGESHVYKFEIVQGDSGSADGKNATQTFTWESRNQ
jgi:hypothetical protein